MKRRESADLGTVTVPSTAVFSNQKFVFSTSINTLYLTCEKPYRISLKVIIKTAGYNTSIGMNCITRYTSR